MFRTTADFIKVWEQEAANTTALLAMLTDASLAQSVTDDARNIGRLACLYGPAKEEWAKEGLPIPAI